MNTNNAPIYKKNNYIIHDNFYLIYGTVISSELFHDMIDYIVECGEYEGDLMEFIGDDEWDFFEYEGRKRPERYEYLEGFLEEISKLSDNVNGLQSIYNARGENFLFIGKIIWSTDSINNFKDGGDVVKHYSKINFSLSKEEENIENERIALVKEKLKEQNQYWYENIPETDYFWIRGSCNSL
jgi:hypothetical protein